MCPVCRMLVYWLCFVSCMVWVTEGQLKKRVRVIQALLGIILYRIALWICRYILFSFFNQFCGCNLINFLCQIVLRLSVLAFFVRELFGFVCIYFRSQICLLVWICRHFFSLSDSCVYLSVFVFFVRQLCGFVCICIHCQIVVWICLYLFYLSDICVDFSVFVLLARYLCGFVCICFTCQIFVWICLHLYSLSGSCGFFLICVL